MPLSCSPLHLVGCSSRETLETCANLKISLSSMEDSGKKRRRMRVREPKPNTSVGVVDMEDFGREETLKIRESLLQWYDQNQRVLPWRTYQQDDQTLRAYAVWVSEVMLQQTRVSTVIDYYNRWMHKWPSLHHLAQASQEGAKMVVGGGGEFPRTVSALREVRGIGDYTAGAIASIAFKEAVPVVDGNVIRVIARLKANSANPRESETIKNIWKLAGQLVDPSRPGDFNQALMELGSTLCTPTSPGCSICPVSGQCHALSLSRNIQTVQVTNYPIKVVKAKQKHDFCAVCVVEILEERNPDIEEGSHKSNGFLLVKRPDEGLLAGLWEFPSVLLDGEADLVTRREAMDQYLKKSFKIDTKKKCSIMLREDVGECVHVFTHIRRKMYIELLVLHLKGGVKVLHGKEGRDTLAWKCVDSNCIQSLGLTSGVRKAYNMIRQFKQNRLPINPTSRTRKKTKKLCS